MELVQNWRWQWKEWNDKWIQQKGNKIEISESDHMIAGLMKNCIRKALEMNFFVLNILTVTYKENGVGDHCNDIMNIVSQDHTFDQFLFFFLIISALSWKYFSLARRVFLLDKTFSHRLDIKRKGGTAFSGELGAYVLISIDIPRNLN